MLKEEHATGEQSSRLSANGKVLVLVPLRADRHAEEAQESVQGTRTRDRETRRKRIAGTPGEHCVCGTLLQPGRRLRVCAPCHAKQSAESYSRHRAARNRRRAERRANTQALTEYHEQDRAYERVGLARAWLKKSSCACGSSHELKLVITREPKPSGKGTRITARVWTCASCRAESDEATLRSQPIGEAGVYDTTGIGPSRADEMRLFRRQHIFSWIAELAPEVRAAVDARSASMRNPAIPTAIWQRSVLARDAAIAAYEAIVGVWPVG